MWATGGAPHAHPHIDWAALSRTRGSALHGRQPAPLLDKGDAWVTCDGGWAAGSRIFCRGTFCRGTVHRKKIEPNLT